MSKRTKKMTASDFVRSQGQKPAKDVVAAAKKKRIKLNERYVYVIRSADKAKARRKGHGKPGRKPNGRSDETALRTAIAELGLTRSREVLAEVERAFGG